VQVRVFESELAVLVDEIARHVDVETGGDLFGLWSHGDAATVFLATRPGPAAIREPMYFRQDAATHREIEALVWDRFGAQCVGLWHSHHRLGLRELSRGDLERTMRYARRYRRRRFVDLLGYFDDDERVVARPFAYVDATLGRTEATELVVLPGVSPLRAALADRVGAAPPLDPRWGSARGTPLRPDRAAAVEGADGDEMPALPDVAGADATRALDAVERFVEEHVPAVLLATMTLDVRPDGAFLLGLGDARRRLDVALGWDGALRVRGWRAGRRATSPTSPSAAIVELRAAIAALLPGDP
jgi:hypothetical protein